MTTLYKCTLAGGHSVHGFPDQHGLNYWPLPHHNGKRWHPGAWKIARGTLKPHFGGLHLAPEHMLIHWLREEIYLVETHGKTLSSTDCTVARKARLVKRLHLPDHASHKLALELAELALATFTALVYPWDMRRRLEYALEVAYGSSKYHPDDIWRGLQEVVEHCNTDQFSGYETNLNVMAAKAAAEAVLELRHLGQGRNWQVIKNQAAFLIRALPWLVEDLYLKHGTGFNIELVPDVARQFMQPHPFYQLPHHQVRFAVSQWCNNKLLPLLEDYV